MPAFFNSSRIFSRNLRGIFFFLEISEMRTGPCSYFSTRWVNALNAYCAFLDNIRTLEYLQFIVNWRILLQHSRYPAVFFQGELDRLFYFFLVGFIRFQFISDKNIFKYPWMFFRLIGFRLNLKTVKSYTHLFQNVYNINCTASRRCGQ